MSDALLRLDHVAVEIRGRRALHDVVLEVPEGGSVGIVGETGSGKSLTCRVMLGMLGRIHAEVVAGTATFDGADLSSLSHEGWRRVRGRGIGFVPQASGASLDPIMRIGKQIEETVHVLDPEADPRARAVELLEMVRISGAADVARRYPNELSGGMRQRVMIALALAGRPRLLVADEATTALDVTIQRAILDLLTELRRELNMALVLVTHDLGLVESTCEEVAVMYAGATIECGSVDTVLGTPAHPYTQALMAAQPSLAAIADGRRLLAVSGAPPELGSVRDGCSFAPRCAHAASQCEGGDVALETVRTGHDVACRRTRETPRWQ